MKKIAFLPIKRNSPFGGSESLWTQTALKAQNSGHNVHVFTYQFPKPHPIISKLKECGAHIHIRTTRSNHISKFKRGVFKVRAYLNWRFDSIERSLQPLKKYHFDLLVISQGSWYDLSDDQELLRAIRKYKLPYVIICHSFQDVGLLHSTRKLTILSVYKSAKMIYFVANRQREVVEKYLAYKIKNSRVVLNPLNLTSYRVLPCYSDRPLRMVMISSLVTRWKGHDLLLEALSCQKWKVREWQLLIYGQGEDELQISELISFYGLQEKVKLLGFCNDPELALKEAHILIVPSRVEAAPLVIYEAFLSGRPVLATDVGDIGEVVIDGCNGFLAEAAHPKYISRALDRMWDYRYQLDELGKAAFESVRSKFIASPEETFLSYLLKDAEN
ncbi:glycosyltransferase family 4 protein [uncultured Roseivirga sp.]|uniref:glycosyltransferase family 4 protein n=1 Tax=uncultured Roseivirga sp. TaxID=543088 RepID=UPI000D7A1F4C|nr:glycosyltransferase family 4 protein [uncultured Roseivirga sp.]PWL32328.1 MAG: hypothetical protein DCO95_03885 [Roseivirga sp. XM-24bin3]